MANKLFVGGLPYSTTDDELRDLASQYGSPVSVSIIMDRETNRSKGFGFVEFETDEEAQAAIKGMNGADVGGRTIIVNEARPPRPRNERSFNDRDSRGGGRRY